MYQQNTSQVVGFTMVTTAGLADSTATLGIAANRIIENGALQSCVGVVINKTQGAWALVMDSSDCNGKQVSLFLTAPGDVPLGFTFPTTTANPHDAVAFGLSRLDSNISSRMGATPLINNLSNLDSTVSSRMGATPLINNLANLDSTVSSRMGTFGVPGNFSGMIISAAGIVSANTAQVNAVPILGDGNGTPFHV